MSKETHTDDSDIDDLLDDVLDNMNQTTEKPKTKTTITEEKEEDLDDLMDNDEFAKQLAAGMEHLMGQFEQEGEMKNTFEKVWASFDTPEKNREASKTTQPQSFQEAIGKTMDKLKDSSKEIDSSIAEDSEEAFMAELMKQMESLADNGEFENVLEGMMSQLMSKELLYEPMKDLSQKYPEWLENNKDKVKAEDYDKYRQQQAICQQIVAIYEAPGFDEKNEVQAKNVMDLMTKMQDLGQPPAELLDEMAPGMNFGNPNAVPDIKDLENCNVM
ncbi:hypothetical protein G6F57_005052 [Rhizopus arrhizus]|uniref:Pex19 protein n=1 Tax=Rhizopus oryzae TaxID=64495 RepID=A0A9P7BTW7_RHIOR|nr:hypothetical protein G6F23_000592 [Rhizopus arrhizus]KAG1423920.1 hypothetical protein G6F58_002625 [Rhizopus delemar]KAG0756057.1 hypothetical protein G6F24_011414 [Rhizopus arrhizus]KAG0791782.1 hypothetical protein G6F21_004831 [Rhizopus arrhizus]KAG0799198.1 hypothetical protein G6F22_003470 [Rhizopus arrhizus]